MNTTAHSSSDLKQPAEIDRERAELEARAQDLKQKIARAPDKTTARTLKATLKRVDQLIADLDTARRPALFDEARVLADLEQDIRDAIAEWEEQRRDWLDEARYDPTYAIQHGADIIAQQTRAAQVVSLRRAWEAVARTEGRTLAAFRKAYDQVAAQRRQMLAAKPTAGRTSELYNAVSHAQARTLIAYGENSDSILARLTRCETLAARQSHTA